MDNTSKNQILAIPAEDLEEIKKHGFYSNLIDWNPQAKMRATCWTRGYGVPGKKGKVEKCFYSDIDGHMHFEHCHMDTLEDMTRQGENRDGYILGLLVGIGNKLTDFVFFVRWNLESLFNKLDALAKAFASLPTKEEYAEERKDDKHILELLKMVARRQGMTQKQIDDLRPIEYTAPEEEQV